VTAAKYAGCDERQGATVMMRSYETINRDTALQFLKATVNRHPDAKGIHLISDNAKYFHARKVQEFVVVDPRLQMHFFAAVFAEFGFVGALLATVASLNFTEPFLSGRRSIQKQSSRFFPPQ
jgi:hypothetical protein